MSRGLTVKKKKLVAGVAKGELQGKAAIKAGYSPKSADSQASQILKEPKVQEALQSALKRAGVTEEAIAQKIKEGLDAIHPNFGSEDYGVRQKYIDTAVKIIGGYSPEKHKVEVTDYSELKGEELDERLKTIKKAEDRITKGKGKKTL